jgi:hypothetical protein
VSEGFDAFRKPEVAQEFLLMQLGGLVRPDEAGVPKIPLVQSPPGFGRSLRVWPAGCNARAGTLDYPAMEN